MKSFSKWMLAAIIMIILQLLLNSGANAAEFKITIIDTGIDLKNSALKSRLCQNEGEIGRDVRGRAKETNGIDDDDNGLVDDLYGWSFFDHSNNIQDNHGHGTHIASIIFQELKHLKLENQFCFQILKYYDSETFTPNILNASNNSFRYAFKNGSRLINYSGGGYSPSNEEEFWLKQLAKKNIPVLAAMGNQTVDTDLIPFYPASYALENIFAIAAADEKQTRAKFSNYGRKRFDFMAPGVNIKGFGLNNSTAFFSGTSQATAQASALLAYLLYQNQNSVEWKDLKTNLKILRKIYSRRNRNVNSDFLDTDFIQKFKTSQVDAFGDP